MLSAVHLSCALVAVNFAAFVAFWWDKRRARAGARRIAERTLLWLALVGGSVGAICAQHLFRHKTRKEPFRSRLYGIVLLHAAGVVL